ncbi:MAG: hypothetical protein R3240_01820, partial [Gammaproteobacteria bacterium]|nr:hypothetical protein [Gammaproteobacteria bacterium]
SLLIISPLWLTQIGVISLFEPVQTAIACAFLIIFFLGVFLGKVSGTFWLLSGLQTLVVASFTCLVIFLLV